MGVLGKQVLDVAGTVAKRAAPAQAGIFSGSNPSVYNASDPIQLWIIQVVIIIGMTQLLSLILSRIRQPRVIAEVIGGVILGPSIMGRIPHFTATIFPTASMPMLSLTSTIGLVLFLFLVGLEIDVRLIKKNVKASAAISIAGLVLPLGLGAALAVPLYHEFIDEKVNFGYFILFTAVAIGITAFPVLCRILTELKLLDTTVGVLVLSAGVGNDIVGWILLALTVALVNASSGLTALWVLLTSVGYVIFLLIPVKRGFRYLARRTGSLESGQPTAFMMTITLLVVFFSAFFTDIIGVHPIFGGFLAGLIIPHDNGFAIALVEKLEDVVSILFLPLYFAYSGLRTNLGLLDNAITWGYTILICVVAFSSKFLGCSIAAKLCGFNLRESGAVGALMSCKGLVELIVLNVGLQAGILDTRTFSMFVLHALILTFMTTPLTILLYPAKYRTHAGNARDPLVGSGAAGRPATEEDTRTKFAIVLDKIDQLPAAMSLTQLLQRPFSSLTPSISTSDEDQKSPAGPPTLPYTPILSSHRITIDALRLIELTNRTSAVLKSQEADSLIHSDPIVSVFRTFGYLNRLAVSAALSVVSFDEYSSSVTKHVQDHGSQMVLVPWSTAPSLNVGPVSEPAPAGPSTTASYNPFEGLFSKGSSRDPSSAVVYTQFVRKVFAETPADIALFLDRSSNSLDSSGRQHILLPFFGGPDDRLALAFVVQLCSNPAVSATVVRIAKTEHTDLTPIDTIEHEKSHALQSTIMSHINTLSPDTVYGQRDTSTRLASDTADNIIWGRFTSPSSVHAPEVTDALTRITFQQENTAHPLRTMYDISARESRSKNLLVAVGRSRRLAAESHDVEYRQLMTTIGGGVSSEVRKTLGDVAAALVGSGTNASILVLQASQRS
ncbi:hypothetical protein JAAARDRAFT_52200 [Jaapia argillacea MUCL 33604]|uniref:Cation/H+ exchanger transmembrane domain-containing protein n=1 Tax=Jaapia argillacea MUCL 33604 TaxID=933084 RepID=A0A067QDG4_9AGAM|nr:hypothetical protein JAAARDRAFT_52200 [Jaapia argillacea MUCL 33604]